MTQLVNLTPHALSVHSSHPDAGLCPVCLHHGEGVTVLPPGDPDAGLCPVCLHHGQGVVGIPSEVVTVLPPSGEVARVVTCDEEAAPVAGIPCMRTTYGDIVGLPDPVAGVTYVVSGMVLAQCDRADVVAPGPLLRDEAGHPIGCTGLRRR